MRKVLALIVCGIALFTSLAFASITVEKVDANSVRLTTPVQGKPSRVEILTKAQLEREKLNWERMVVRMIPNAPSFVSIKERLAAINQGLDLLK